jgi:membrane protein YqaA with SNARE-associated domain
MRLSFNPNTLFGYVSFFIFGICGLAGVLVDLDHVAAYFLQTDARFCHQALLIVAGLIFGGIVAYFIGFYLKYILKRRKCN